MDIIAGVLGGTSIDNSLDTRKIDRNIVRLKELDWFKTIYDEERYHRLFFINRNIRGYLQSRSRVNKIIRSEQAQIKFMRFLDKQIQS
ncbi:hypothetical protein [Paenisporosarcina sp. OV554]|uniref:hypothetical protein n=1 Tax=Paenisporosarcina sp. OV554 TaxID=2135694 RepID=UPI001304EFE9|nr:hypothetical protein [Paenisporosarcina sp. OV554]